MVKFDIKQNIHFYNLHNSYLKVGYKTWQNDDFQNMSLQVSRNLFKKNSLSLKKPKPKALEVIALLSGLAFSTNLCKKISTIQNDISTILNGRLHYWVKPNNLGVEYCVFKWPDGVWKKSWLKIIINQIASQRIARFNYFLYGIQINQDGCVIVKGYDESESIFNIRNRMRNNLDFFPKKQSSWAHIPIGRILEPVGKTRFSELRKLVSNLSNNLIATELISSIKLIHETRWYMEERKLLYESTLD